MGSSCLKIGGELSGANCPGGELSGYQPDPFSERHSYTRTSKIKNRRITIVNFVFLLTKKTDKALWR